MVGDARANCAFKHFFDGLQLSVPVLEAPRVDLSLIEDVHGGIHNVQLHIKCTTLVLS